MKGDNMKKQRGNKMDPIGNLVRYGSFSAKWTTFFAVVALFSVLTLSLTQVSFALQDWPNELTDPRIDEAGQLESEGVANGVPHGVIKNKYIKKNGQEIPVYCLEEWKGYSSKNSTGKNFTKTDSRDLLDDGAVALLTEAYAKYQNKPDARQQAIIQLALWAYLYDYSPNSGTWKQQAEASGSSGMSADQMKKLREGSLWDDIEPWITFAQAHSQSSSFGDPKITFSKASDTFTTSGSNNEYVISGEITVSSTTTETLKTFRLGLDGAPDNTSVIVIKGGSEREYNMSDFASTEFTSDDLASGIKLKVKIPTASLTEESKSFKLTASGDYSYYVGYQYYLNDSWQQIAVGDIDTKTNVSELPLTASFKVHVPETAQDSSLALYLVGLIVLLCGAGIVYVNVKPAKQK